MTGEKIHFKKQGQPNELKKKKSCTEYVIPRDGLGQEQIQEEYWVRASI